jgi:hypothetical protein
MGFVGIAKNQPIFSQKKNYEIGQNYHSDLWKLTTDNELEIIYL